MIKGLYFHFWVLEFCDCHQAWRRSMVKMVLAWNLKRNFGPAFCKSILALVTTLVVSALVKVWKNMIGGSNPMMRGQVKFRMYSIWASACCRLLPVSEYLQAKVAAYTSQSLQCQSEIACPCWELPMGLSNSTDLRAEVRCLGHGLQT